MFICIFSHRNCISVSGSECHSTGIERVEAHDELRGRRSEFEDERQRSKIGHFRNKTLNASNKITHSLKKRGNRKIDYRVRSVSIEDVRDAKEECAVLEMRQKLIEKDLLPARHDDYYTLLRFLTFLWQYEFIILLIWM